MSTPMYPVLGHFLRAYLIPDWDRDYADEDEAVDDFFRGTPDGRRGLALEISSILAKNPTEAELETLFEDLGSTYVPFGYVGGCRSWLKDVQSRAGDVGTA